MPETSPAIEKKKFPLIPLITCALLVYFIVNDPGRAWNILKVLLSFGMIIFVHEMGHFLAAKAVGIKVEEFAIGFGRILLGWRKTKEGTRIRFLPKKISETESQSLFETVIGKPSQKECDTEYQFRVFPLGGFVKMLGQEDLVTGEKSDDPRSYMNKAVWQRLIVISAGVTVNIIIGFILFIGIFSHGVDVPAAVIGQVMEDKPAARAGMKTGDEIIAINGEKGKYQFLDLRLAGAFLDDNEGVELTVRRSDGTTETLTVVPEYDEAYGIKLMGIGSSNALTIASINEQKVQKILQEMNLLAGDTLVAVNHQEISRFDQYLEAMKPENFNPTTQNITLAFERIERTTPSRHDLVLPVKFTGTSEKPTILGMLPRLKLSEPQIDKPATKAGIKANDIVLQFGLIKNPTYKEFKDITDSHIGKDVEMVVLREEKGSLIEKTLVVTPEPVPQNWLDRLHKKKKEAIIGVIISKFVRDLEHPVVAQCFEYGDGEKLSLPRGALITQINQTPVHKWEDLMVALTDQAGQDVTIHYQIDKATDQSITVSVPSGKEWCHYAWVIDFNGITGLPFEPLMIHIRADSLGEAVSMGAKETYAFISQTYMSLKGIFSGNVSPKGFMGPVGILKMTYTVAKDRSIIDFFHFMAMLNVLIAVFNFLPIPILDGGHAVMLIIEKIKGSPVSVKIQEIVTYAGMIMLGSLVLYVTFNDIVRAFGT